jgi:hypothetical protein
MRLGGAPAHEAAHEVTGEGLCRVWSCPRRTHRCSVGGGAADAGWRGSRVGQANQSSSSSLGGSGHLGRGPRWQRRDHVGAELGVRGEEAVAADPVKAGRRNHGANASDEIERFEHQGGGAVAPGLLHGAGGSEPSGERRAQQRSSTALRRPHRSRPSSRRSSRSCAMGALPKYLPMRWAPRARGRRAASRRPRARGRRRAPSCAGQSLRCAAKHY